MERGAWRGTRGAGRIARGACERRYHPVLMSLRAGTRLGRYEIRSPLGSGGMGDVWRALDPRLGREVAIKVIGEQRAADTEARQRFEREARAAATLSHPGICTIHEVGEEDGRLYFVMELLEGQPLAELIEPPLPTERLLSFAVQAAEALDAAHARGVVHRDVKPANLFVTTHGHLKILDFGIAKRTEPSTDVDTGADEDSETRLVSRELTTAGAAIGTVSYMSPEQVSGLALDRRTDVFSLGVVIYEMATGTRPFRGTTSALIFDGILNRAPAPPASLRPELPPGLGAILEKALAKDRAQRYQTAAELAADLRRLQADPSFVRATAPAASSTLPAARTSRGRLFALAAAGLAIVAAAAAGFFALRQRAAAPALQVLGAKDTIVVAEFENRTGDTAFDEALRQALVAELENSPFLGVIPAARMRETLRLMSRREDEKVVGSVAREVCVRTGSKVLLSGTIAQLGSRYALALDASACVDGTSVTTKTAQADSKDDVLAALSKLTTDMRATLGESMRSLAAFENNANVTTRSLEALRWQALGDRAEAKEGNAAALPFYQKAVEADPEFCMGWVSVGVQHLNLGQVVEGRKALVRAFELRSGVSERERLYAEAFHALYVTGDLDAAARVFRVASDAYPRDRYIQANLAAVLGWLGRVDEALEPARRAVENSPDNGVAYVNLAGTYRMLGRDEESFATLEAAARNGVVMPLLTAARHQFALLRGDRRGIEAAHQAVRGQPLEVALFTLEGDWEAQHGRETRARELYDRARGLARSVSGGEPGSWVVRHITDRLLGRAGAPIAQLRGIAARESSSDRAAAALALAFAGAAKDAERIIASLEREAPQSTEIVHHFAPLVRAVNALAARDPARAVRELEATSGYERLEPTAMERRLLPHLVRGRALAALGRPADAAAEFAAIVDHPQLLVPTLVHPLARWEFARACASAGETARAAAAYDALLTEWKDADPGFEPAQRARRERAALTAAPAAR